MIPGPHSGSGKQAGRDGNPGLPRWLYLGAVLVIVLLLVAAMLHLAGGGPGGHGPWRHLAPSGPRQETPPGGAEGQRPLP
jgi:hypothetical protein